MVSATSGVFNRALTWRVISLSSRAVITGVAFAVPAALMSLSANMDIGRDNGLVVDLAYEDEAPYTFSGTVRKIVFDLKPATHEDEQALHAQAHTLGQGAAG